MHSPYRSTISLALPVESRQSRCSLAIGRNLLQCCSILSCSIFSRCCLVVVLSLFLHSCSLPHQSSSPAAQHWQQAKSLSQQGKYLDAARMFEKSASSEQESTHPRPAYVSLALNGAGHHYSLVGQYDKAIKLFNQALQIDKKLGNQAGVAAQLNNIGIAYKAQGKFDKAIKHYQQALAINKQMGQEKNLAISLNNIGTVYKAWGQLDKAIDSFQQALAINRRLDEEKEVATNLNNIGHVYDTRGQFSKALEYYEQALELNKKHARDAERAINLNNIGMVYGSWGHFDKAITYYQQAMEIDKRLGMKAELARDLNNIGFIYNSWGRFDRAIEHYQQALQISQRVGNEAGIATLLNNIGLAYSAWGRLPSAMEYYQQALAINKRLGKQAETAVNLNNIGHVNQQLGQFVPAVDYYQQALEISKRVGNKAEITTSLNNIAVVHTMQGRFAEAIELLEQVLRINRKLGKEAAIALNLNNIGRTYKAWGQIDKAIAYLLQSIQLLEKIRRTAAGDIRRDYLANQLYIYQGLASAYLQKDDPQGVLDSIEQSRARLLAERITGIDEEPDLPLLDEIQRELADDEAVLLFSNMDQDNFILMVITGREVTMKELSKDRFLARSRKQYKKPILMLLEKQRGKLIESEETGKEGFFEETTQQLDFVSAIHYYRTLLTNPDQYKEAGEFSRLLYQLLIEPAAEILNGKKKLTIMPDGILGFLPFETLTDKTNSYLAQEYSLRYTQSLTIDTLLGKRDYTQKDQRRPMLAMGGAVYNRPDYRNEMIDNVQQLAVLQNETDRAITEKRSARNSYSQLGMGSWANLPGTLKEVGQLSSIVKESDTLTGEEVSENRIKHYSEGGKLADYKVLHFATHGLVVPQLPELSALVLSQFQEEQEGEDGYLRMGEIAELNLAADFVNLSACETGLGKIYGGEGVVGLTQSFLIAGANGLAVSLWQVADESTSRFMTELYRKVENSNMGYNQALTETKREFINGDYGKQWQNPYYWSPFVYYGK